MAMGNFFDYVCPSCGGLYQDIVENGLSKLLHKGLTSTQDTSPLPTKACVRSHNYVRFDPCGHCCPEVFEECRPCLREKQQSMGHPSKQACYCHYCYVEAEQTQATQNDSKIGNTYNISTGGAPYFEGNVTVGGDLVAREQYRGTGGTDSSPTISLEAKELLIAAADTGEIHVLSTQQVSGKWVRIQGKDYLDRQYPALAARYLQTLQELHAAGYVTHHGGVLYIFTSAGFTLAQRLKTENLSKP